jgi:hypothetical protein
MVTSDPRVFHHVSLFTTASVSTAMRWPPANCTCMGGSGSSAVSDGAAEWAAIDVAMAARRASSARENSAS